MNFRSNRSEVANQRHFTRDLMLLARSACNSSENFFFLLKNNRFFASKDFYCRSLLRLVAKCGSWYNFDWPPCYRQQLNKQLTSYSAYKMAAHQDLARCLKKNCKILHDFKPCCCGKNLFVIIILLH